jgi:DNA transposition AAA+ family ATPase
MNQIQKTQIHEELQKFIQLKGSQNKAAGLGLKSNEWVCVNTRDYKIVTSLLDDAQNNSMCYAVTGDAGTGKTYAMRQYSNTNENTFMLCCNEYWNRKYFLAELLTSMGRDNTGLTVAEMMATVVRELRKMESPLIIMDEADKLSDNVLYFFITLYNQLEDECGIVLAATDHLAKVINRGLKLNKKGYKEIFSRLGRNFIPLKGVGSTDVQQICNANGIKDKDIIQKVFNESEGDIRRVKRKIHSIKMMYETDGQKNNK